MQTQIKLSAIGLAVFLGYILWGIGGTQSIILAYGTFALCILCILTYARPLDGLTLPQSFGLCVPAVLWMGLSTAYITFTPWLGKRECLLVLQAIYVAILTYSLLHFALARRILLIGWVLLIISQVCAACYQQWIEAYWLPMGLQLPVYSGRSSGTFGSPNHLGAFLAMSLFPAIAFSMASNGWMRWASRIVVLLCILGLALSASRGALLAVVCTGLCMPLMSLHKPSTYLPKAFKIGTLCTVLMGLAYAYIPAFHARYHFALSEVIDTTRITFWKAALSTWWMHPFIGNGPGTFNSLFEHFRPQHFVHQPVWVHNDYLNILTDYGCIGFVCMVGPVLWIMFQAWKTLRVESILSFEKAAALGAFWGLVAFCMHSFVEFNTHIPGLVFTLSSLIAWMLFHLNAIQPAKVSTFNAFGQWTMIAFSGMTALYAYPLYTANALQKKSQDTLDYWVQEERITHVTTQDFQKVRNNLERATQLEPHNADIWNSLSLCAYYQYMNWKEPNDAQICLNAGLRASDLCSEYWLYWVSYGLGLAINHEYEGMHAAFQTAVERAPRHSMAWYYYALALRMDTSRPDKTLSALEKAIELNPRNHYARSIQDQIIRQLQADNLPLPSL